jgi:hypothetical protein
MAVDQHSTLTIAAPVKMVVMDGIVMGPTVSYIFQTCIEYCNKLYYSIVLLIIVLRI